MNGKKSKRLRKQTNVILVDWLKSLLDEEEAATVTLENCRGFLPEQAYFYSNQSFKLHPYSIRWTFKKMKLFHKKFPHVAIEDIDHDKLKWVRGVG